jgi:hypothetical protein
MQRSIVAAIVALSLGACSSENDGTVNPTTGQSNVIDIPALDNESPAVVNDPDASGGTASDSGSNESDATSDNTNTNIIVVDTTAPTAPTSGTGGQPSGGSGGGGESGNTGDDAGSATSDGGETSSGGISDDAGSATSDGGETPSGGISDDAGSATSDGGETPSGGISDDAGSATSDGGETSSGGISDDAGSATSDGGETDSSGISDDAGSATSDGGQANTDDSGSDGTDERTVNDDDANGDNAGAGGQEQSGPTVAPDFESDSTGGSVIRRSVLSAAGSANICTTASGQNNFSDTRVGDFILHNNAWRPWRAAEGYEWSQCIYTNRNGALAGWEYDWGPGISGINGNPDPAGDYYVRSYPELIYGVKDEYRTSAPKSVTGFPVKLADMPNITIDYSYNGPQYGVSRPVTASNNARFPNGTTISGERNIAIESFLYNPDASGQCSEGIVSRDGGSNHVYEVMVWLDAGAERLPAGPSDFVTNVSIRGEAFKVYTKGSDNRYIAFVAQNPQSTGTLVWNDFTDWARTYAHQVRSEFGARSNSVQIQDSWCVANIIVGTEIFWGAGNLDILDWTITQRS